MSEFTKNSLIEIYEKSNTLKYIAYSFIGAAIFQILLSLFLIYRGSYFIGALLLITPIFMIKKGYDLQFLCKNANYNLRILTEPFLKGTRYDPLNFYDLEEKDNDRTINS